MKTFEIPTKDWNAEKGKMEDTSSPEWQKYYADLEAFQMRMYEKKPQPQHYGWDRIKGWPSTDGAKAFANAMNEWNMALSCDAPNKPGYYRANND